MLVPGYPFQPSVIFVSKAGAYQREVPSRCSDLGHAFGLTRKYKTRMEKPVRDKHSSLL
jgi:hypothetical protein